MAQGFIYSQSVSIPVSVAQGGTGVTTATGSGTAVVLQTSPIILTPNVTGVTNASNAPAGSVGEVISSYIPLVSGILLTNATPTNITSISLTAGDWDVSGNVGFKFSAFNGSAAVGWVSLTSATEPNVALETGRQPNAAVEAQTSFGTPYLRVNISSTTTVYLSGYCISGSGTNTACGFISARRMR